MAYTAQRDLDHVRNLAAMYTAVSQAHLSLAIEIAAEGMPPPCPRVGSPLSHRRGGRG